MLPQVKSTWRASPPVFALENCTTCQGTGWQLVTISGTTQARRCPCRDLKWKVRLKESIGIPQRYEHCSLDVYTPFNLSQTRALAAVRRFVERYPAVSRGLFLEGPPGTGKTHLAVAILHELAGRFPEELLFADFEMITQSRRPASLQSEGHLLTRLRRASLLVIDNFGSGAPTAEKVALVHELLEVRLRRRRPTVFTGEAISCRELFQRAASSGVSRTQAFLSAYHPVQLTQFLSAVKILPVNGEDYRRSVPALFS